MTVKFRSIAAIDSPPSREATKQLAHWSAPHSATHAPSALRAPGRKDAFEARPAVRKPRNTDAFEVGPALVPGRPRLDAQGIVPRPAGPVPSPSPGPSPVPVPVPSPAPAPPKSFSDQVRGQAPNKELDLDLMKMSSDSYNLGGSGDKYTKDLEAHGWKRLEADAQGRILDRQGQPTGLTQRDLEDAGSGFRAAIYQNDKGEVVTAFAGTHGLNGPDVVADVGQGLGLKTAQYAEAAALATKVKSRYGDAAAFTGHSLGGGLASAAAVATGSPAVTFNAAGLSDDTIRDLGQSPYAARQAAGDGQIRTYHMGLDPLTSTQNATAMPDALGTQLDLQYRALPNLGNLLSPLPWVSAGEALGYVGNAHMQDTLVEALSTQTATPAHSLTGDPVGLTLEMSERGQEAVANAVLEAADQTAAFGQSTEEVIGRVARDVLRTAQEGIAQGRPDQVAAGVVGEVLGGALEVGADAIDRATNVVGRVVENAGGVLANDLAEVGEYLGLKKPGQVAGGAVAQAADVVGQGIDRAGDAAKAVAERLSNFLNPFR